MQCMGRKLHRLVFCKCLYTSAGYDRDLQRRHGAEHQRVAQQGLRRLAGTGSPYPRLADLGGLTLQRTHDCLSGIRVAVHAHGLHDSSVYNAIWPVDLV